MEQWVQFGVEFAKPIIQLQVVMMNRGKETMEKNHMESKCCPLE